MNPTPLQPRTPPTMSSLVTPELIARALAKPSLTIEKKYVEVYEEYTIKLGPGVMYYEYRVLKFLETHPRIPTPRPVDFFSIRVPKKRRVKGQFEEYMEEWNVIVMSTMPGRPLGSTIHCMSPDQRAEVLKEVEVAMNQFNEEIELGMGTFFAGATGDLKPLQRPHHSISDLDGLKCLKLPLRNGFTDSVVDIEDFIKTMSLTARQPEARVEMLNSVLSLLQPQPHIDIGSSPPVNENPGSIRFCHMDLHLDNIMVQDGQLSVSSTGRWLAGIPVRSKPIRR